jgi:hypothetical protein
MMTKRISSSLAIAAFMLIVAAALRYAQGLDWIGPETARRMVQGMIGLVLAFYANYMPKDIASRGSARAVSRSQSALRVGGWSLTVAGLVDAALWAVAPIAFARVAALVVIGTATLVTVGYAGWIALSCRWRPQN